MPIPFTQYLLPNGKTKKIQISLDLETEDLANQFIEAGGCFEAEMLTDYKTVSLTACFVVDDEMQDIASEVIENGPEVPEAVKRLVESATEFLLQAETKI
jgi:hypothetical protein